MFLNIILAKKIRITIANRKFKIDSKNLNI